MKYVFDGDYREFRGYVFWNHKPVTIEDRGTLEAIKKDPSFKEYHEKVQVEEAPQEVLADKDTDKGTDKDACPKCGRSFKRGKYMHVKHCKG